MKRPDWLPPGQQSTQKFPTVGERQGFQGRLQDWRLTLSGLVSEPRVWTWQELTQHPLQERVCDIHCVTGWSTRARRFQGWPLSLLFESVTLKDSAKFLKFLAYSERQHSTSLPLELALEDTWLVLSLDGELLKAEQGWPLRTLTPSRYFYKSLKWLREIVVLAEDQLGYWESESSYHNDARPWLSERYAGGSLTAQQLQRFKQRRSFDAVRARDTLILSADLRAWQPLSKDLRGVRFKNCDLRGAELGGVDLRDGSLCNCDLRGARLDGADLRGCDLDGTRFAGAVLENADIRGALVNATSFIEDGERDPISAKVKGLRWTLDPNWLEVQQAFLEGAQTSPESPEPKHK